SNDVVLPGYLDHLNELAASSKWGSFNDVIKSLEVSKEMWPHLIYPSSLLANELENIGRPEDATKVRTKMLTYFETAQKSKFDVPLEGLDAISLIRLNGLEAQIKKMNALKLGFPEAEYNKNLKAKFVMLDKITTEAISIAELGSGIGIVRAYRYLVEGHDALKQEIISFTPPGKSPEYVKSFHQGMMKLAAPLEKQAQDFRDTAVAKIEKESILSSDNGWFLVKNTALIPEYYNENGIVLMDKAGAK
ncbi:MAG: hypothetical protein K2Q18_14690, partial [Bdellovibrionales bacterium]|nr:hypothetical protein [Bdellovibrionales bacterium]